MTEQIRVIYLSSRDVECAMCGISGIHSLAVPWYCGPVAEGESEGGYKDVCRPCFSKWESLHEVKP